MFDYLLSVKKHFQLLQVLLQSICFPCYDFKDIWFSCYIFDSFSYTAYVCQEFVSLWFLVRQVLSKNKASNKSCPYYLETPPCDRFGIKVRFSSPHALGIGTYWYIPFKIVSKVKINLKFRRTFNIIDSCQFRSGW